MLDLNHFKTVNYNFGHAVGDEIIRHFTDICIANLRETDLFGCIGGEDFASVMIKIDQKKIFHMAERIRAAFTSMAIHDREDKIDIDVGVNISLTGIVERVLKNVDDAMYRAKEQGRNSVVFGDF